MLEAFGAGVTETAYENASAGNVRCAKQFRPTPLQFTLSTIDRHIFFVRIGNSCIKLGIE
jgi:hypothetical protein